MSEARQLSIGSPADRYMQSDSDLKAEPQGSEAKSDQPRKQKGLPKKRDTHFLCFPLVTKESVSQLASSLQHFREVTTKPAGNGKPKAQSRNDGTPPRNEDDERTQSTSAETEIHASNELEPNMNLNLQGPTTNSDLQILPSITHRPPGTFHLTLGVMDLSTKEQMDSALNLLQQLDYADIFRKVLVEGFEGNQQHYSGDGQRRSVSTDVLDATQDRPSAAIASLDRPISPPLTTSNRGKHQNIRFTEHSPPQISLMGISTFPSAKSSRVFYAKPVPSTSAPFPLLQFGRAIGREFKAAGFITETRPLVLHATVANMRYATQARGGRTSKGKSWRYGKDRWKDGQVDAREIIKCFDCYGGNVEEYVKGSADIADRQYVWATGIDVNRVAICKMGAEKSEDETLGMVYPPIGEKLIFQ